MTGLCRESDIRGTMTTRMIVDSKLHMAITTMMIYRQKVCDPRSMASYRDLIPGSGSSPSLPRTLKTLLKMYRRLQLSLPW